MRVEQIGDATLEAIRGLVFSGTVPAISTRHPALKFIAAPLAYFRVSGASGTWPASVLIGEPVCYRGAIPFFSATLEAFHHFAAAVNPIVALAAQHLKVFNSVVGLIVVNVVYYLESFEGSA